MTIPTKRISKYFLLTLLLIFILNKNVFAETTTIQPGEDGNDTYLREQLPNSNFGSVDTINLGLSASGQRMRPVLQFNLSSITNGSTITSALLKIFVNLSGSTNNLSASIYRATNAWFENETNWNNRTVNTAWNTAGGDFNSNENDTIGINDTLGWYTFDARLLVRYWMNGTYSNFGFLIRSDEATSGQYRTFFSSDSSASAYRPQLIVNFTSNAAPTVTSLIDDSNNTNRTTIGHNVTFTLNWNDDDSSLARIYICDTNSINLSGCSNKTYCSTGNAATNPVSCGYNVTNNGTSGDNATSVYFGAVCDNANNCSAASSADNFIVQYLPTSLVVAPNGGETINQTANGNFSIRFNVSDNNTDYLFANIYYSGSAGARTNLIIRNLNLTTACTDSDNNTASINNCTYSWNTTNIDGTFFIDLDVNDTLNFTLDSSNAGFNVSSLVDNTAPNITNEAVNPSNITSGRTVTVSADVRDPFNNTVWFSVNNSANILANYTMTFDSNNTFNGTFTAQVNDTYFFKVFANDTRNNLNNTRNWIQFNITTPTAISQNEIFPTTALPSSTIYISSQLNAVDPLVKINASLKTPSGFVFLTDYPQTQNLTNFTAGQNKTVEWFLAVPNTKLNYTLNISYNDNYTHIWNSNNFFVDVSTTAGSSNANLSNSTFVDISAHTNVVSGGVFTAKIFVRDGNGNFVNADNVNIFQYDSLGNLVVGPVGPTTNSSTGIYLYNYTTPTTPEGQWEIVANATRSSTVFMDRQYWKLVGGPFDVRDITVNDNTVPSLSVSVITENTGSVTQDLTLVWNLTRTDTGEVLDSGADTFAVAGKSTRTATVSPSTTYIGSVKITFVGTYSGTEKAGAFKTFNTEASTTPGVSGSGAGISGGYSGGQVYPYDERFLLEILNYDHEVVASSNLKKVSSMVLKNLGNNFIHNLNLKLEGIPRGWYLLNPFFVEVLNPGEVLTFEVEFLLPDLIDLKEKTFNYSVQSQEGSLSRPGLLKITSQKDFIVNEIGIARAKIDNLKNILIDLQNKNINVLDIPSLLQKSIEKINDAERDVVRDEISGALSNLDEGNKLIKESDSKVQLIISEIEKTRDLSRYNFYLFYIFIILGIIAAIILLIKMYRKMSIIKFLEGTEKHNKHKYHLWDYNHDFNTHINEQKHHFWEQKSIFPARQFKEHETNNDTFMNKIREIERRLK
ncbi:DNRLRE domain-containing protein [Candidatus Woesearchaeota archaeon]|nr:DNRLRE domain-containing protein [Candidatus Woesearchaeota archaeon]